MSTDLDLAIAHFEGHGLSDVGYLRLHHGRFTRTKALYEATATRKGGNVLDVGAHWLHQSYLYAADGYRVTAADVPSTLGMDAVKAIAAASGIRLLPYDDLACGEAFASLASDSIDLILFTEIIEHLAFNPIALWRELHRVLSPGGRVVITTPNHAGLRATLYRWRRNLVHPGGGLRVEEILRTPTFGHHWKEYTLEELRTYFRLLSPDFALRKALWVEDYYGSSSALARVSRLVEKAIPPWRPALHVEVELARKRDGITIEPRWA